MSEPAVSALRGRRPRKRLLTWLALPTLLVGVGTSFWLTNREITGNAASGGADQGGVSSQGQAGAPVEVVHPAAGGFRRVTIQPGSVHAFESVDLYAKVAGFLKTQSVDIGSLVQRGQVLAEIEAPELESDVVEATAVVDQAKAQVEQAEARLATAYAEHAAAEAAVKQAQADVERFTAQRALSEKQFERYKSLVEAMASYKRLLDEQEHDLAAARAGERSAQAATIHTQAQVTAASARVTTAKADVVEAHSFVKVAEAKLARVRVLADYTRILSPFDGVVTNRNFHARAFIQSATEGNHLPLLTVMRTDLMRVVVHVPDSDVALLNVGDPATIAIDAIKGHSFSGPVARLAHAEDPATRTMRVEIDLPNPTGQLCMGMYGRATIELQPPSESLGIPLACLATRSGPSQATLFVVEEGRARRRNVATGDDDGIRVEVLSGLSAQDAVVIRARSPLEEGMPVSETLLETSDAGAKSNRP